MTLKTFRKQFLGELLVSTIVVAILHYAALTLYLYWIIEWFDMLVHFVGGVAIGFLAVFIFFTSGYIKPIAQFKHNNAILFSFIFMSTLIIALAWEIWEIFFGISDILIDRNDTIVDLIMGMFGAVFVHHYVKNKIE